MALQNCGWSAFALGETALACDSFREALVLAGRLGAPHFIAGNACGLAAVFVSEHEEERGAQLLGAASSLREELGRGFDDALEERIHEQAVADAKAALGEEAFAAAWARGQAMQPDEIALLCARLGSTRLELCARVIVMSTKTMKAVVRDRYGPPEVLRIEEVERPVPKDDEVLVRIRATTVTRTDVHMRAAKPFIWRFMLGLRRPKARILGVEFAGEVEAVGAAVTRFQVGDRVFGLRNGTHAEYVCVGEERLVAHMPDRMTFEEAAAVCDGFYQGLLHLSHARVGQGTRLAVYGASGSCGTAAVQLGKHHFGAHVTAICNTKNVELVRSLGADEVVDYLNEDFTKRGEKYDVVLDAVGKHSYFRSRRALEPHGQFVASDRLYNIPLSFSRASRIRRSCSRTSVRRESRSCS